MFTGIIQALGKIESMTARSGDMRLQIDAADLPLSDASLGDSIAVNGVCLTAVEYTQSGFVADVSNETLSKTSLGSLTPGSAVNLETALTLATPLGGHLVSGHVDGLGTILDISRDARSLRYRIEVPESLQRYIAEKGSVCMDGVSLTVNAVQGNQFEINIVPHTQERTLFQTYQAGHKVNIEVDVIARYLERLLPAAGEKGDDHLLKTLAESGFIRN